MIQQKFRIISKAGLQEFLSKYTKKWCKVQMISPLKVFTPINVDILYPYAVTPVLFCFIFQ